jgi:hypothetical protein
MTPITGTSDSAARRAAKQIGCRAVKSRWRKDSIDNHGGFQIIDNYHNTIVMGARFELTAEEVIEYCRSQASFLHTVRGQLFASDHFLRFGPVV